MPEFVVGRPIEIIAPFSATGLGVSTYVYDEARNQSAGSATEIGVTGNYYFKFTPDADGEWRLVMYSGSEKHTFYFPVYVEDPTVEGKVDIIDANVDILIQRTACDAGMAASTTVIVCDDLAGYGEDYFNTGWKMCVLQNVGVGHAGTPPENQWRDITNYVTATGTFTVTAFTANVEAGDYILVARDEFANGLKLANHEITRAFWSAPQISVTADTTHTDAVLPSVVLPNIAGTITHAYAGFKFRMIQNTNAGANKLSGAQEIQVKENAAGTFTDCINFVDDQFGVAASTREGGDVCMGNIDVVAEVAAFNKTYAFQWDEPLTDQSSLIFYDVQSFLIVTWY